MRILIVDDRPGHRARLRRELEAGGYEALEAAGCDAALDLVMDAQPHAVVLRVALPGTDGYETCRRIRALELMWSNEGTTGLPIVFLTEDDTLAGRAEGFGAGAADFVLEPSAPGRVLRTVDALLKPPAVTAAPRALIVDDSPLVRRIIIDALEQLGLELVCAADGMQAMDMLLGSAAPFHLVITDYIMPRMNGDELCAHIRRHPALAALPVVVLSATEHPVSLAEIQEAGATDFIAKPFVKEIFQVRIAAHLRHSHLAPGVDERLAGIDKDPDYREALYRFGFAPDA